LCVATVEAIIARAGTRGIIMSMASSMLVGAKEQVRSSAFWPVVSVGLGLGLTIVWSSFLTYQVYSLATGLF
jgi:hypothetical protein